MGKIGNSLAQASLVNCYGQLYRITMDRRMLSRIIFVFYFIGCSFVQAARPLNHAGARGSKVQLNCAEVYNGTGFWNHAKYAGEKEIIAVAERVQKEFRDQFSISYPAETNFNLFFNLWKDTSGRYTCHPNISSVAEYSSEVIALDSQPTCSKEEIPGFVKANCSIGYNGNWAPDLEWYKMNERLETEDKVLDPNIKVTSSLVVPFKKTDPGASYTLTCTPKFKIEKKPSETTATNVPEFPTSCTLTIGSPVAEEAPSMQSTAPPSSISSFVHNRQSLRLCLCLSTSFLLELLYKRLCQ